MHTQVDQLLQRGQAPFSVDPAMRDHPPNHLGNFDIDQMRRVQCLVRRKHHGLNRRCRWHAEQRLDDRRCVDDDHRPSRSARTASAAEIEGVVRGKL